MRCNECDNNGLEETDLAMVDECEVCGEDFYLDCIDAIAGTCGCCMDGSML